MDEELAPLERERLEEVVFDTLNRFIESDNFYDADRFSHVIRSKLSFWWIIGGGNKILKWSLETGQTDGAYLSICAHEINYSIVFADDLSMAAIEGYPFRIVL